MDNVTLAFGSIGARDGGRKDYMYACMHKCWKLSQVELLDWMGVFFMPARYEISIHMRSLSLSLLKTYVCM